jgi:hypothetical protein
VLASLTNVGKYLLALASVLGGAAALLALAAAVRTWYRRNLGRRRDRYERIARLGTGAQLSFFASVLGEPPAIRRTITKDDSIDYVGPGDPRFDPSLADPEGFEPMHEVLEARSYTESVFIDRDYYVQTISDYDETVLAFSVTTRNKRFAPVFEVPRRMGRLDKWRWRRRFGERYDPLLVVRLGRTRFADLDPSDPGDVAGSHLRISVGAHNFAYSEYHSFGNPGNYQSFVVTASDIAWGAPLGQNMLAAQAEIGSDEWPPQDGSGGLAWEAMPTVHAFRRESAITTFTVIAPQLWERNYPSTFGPHLNDVRTIP